MRDLPDLLEPGDLLVLNDTRVLPTRLVGRRGESTVEVTLHAARAGRRAGGRSRGPRASAGRAIAWSSRRIFLARCWPGARAARSRWGSRATRRGLIRQLEAYGAMPLPPYIKRPRGGDPRDRDDYQTLFARRAGAVAAPTAALHFTAPLMAALARRGIEHAFVTLHVGAGTFLPVRTEAVEDHVMHAEWYEVPAATAAAGRARAGARRPRGRGRHHGAAHARERGRTPTARLAPGAGETRLFITPGYRFKAVDRLLTNFHLPRSTLFMLTAAFAGLERMQPAYAHAIAQSYRFYSYGDACLLAPAEPAR